MLKTFTLYVAHLNSGISGANALAREYRKGNPAVSKFTCVGTDEDAAYKTLVKNARASVKFTWVNHMSNFLKRKKKV